MLTNELTIRDRPATHVFRWWPIYVALVLLMVATVSPAQETATSAQSILPKAKLTQIKLVCRAFVAASLLASVFFLSYRKNGLPLLMKFSPLILFGVYAIVSSSWSALPKVSFNQAGSFGILILLSYCICLFWQTDFDNERLLKFLSWALLGISILLLGMRVAVPQYGALTREADGLLHSTSASATASLGLLIVLLCCLIWNWQWSRQLAFAAIPIHLLTMLVSGNRLSCAITTLVAGSAMILLCRRERVAVAALIFGFIGTSYLLLDPNGILLDEALTKAGVLASQGQSTSEIRTLSGRTEMWAKIVQQIEDSPWKGHGYFVSSRKGTIYVWYHWGNWTAHNMWLQLLVTSGIIGAAIFAGHLVVLSFSMVQLSSCRFESSRRYLLFFCFIAAWYFGWGMLNSSIFGPTSPDAVVFFVVTGLLLANSSAIAGRRQ